MIILIIVGILVFIGALIWLSFYIEKKRTEALRQAALRLGLNFQPKGDPVFQNELSAFHLFNQGHSRVLKNLMRGNNRDADMAVFDYRYVTGSGKNSHTHSHTVIWFQTMDMNLPAFTLGPENIMHKIGALVGYQDIDLPRFPEFSKRYLLRGQNEAAITVFFNDSAARFFEARRNIRIEAGGTRFIMYGPAKKADPEKLRELINEGAAVLELFRSAR
jgi:hypothetical protein